MIVEPYNRISRAQQWWTSTVACFSLLLILLIPVSASAAGAISQGFSTSNANISAGSLLSFGSSQGVVEPATNKNVLNLVGIASSGSLIELSNNSKNIQVVVSGLTEALVSNVNGTIRSGDKITASPFQGIGMKATSATEIVGVAQSGLDSSKAIQETVTDKNGKKDTIDVGSIPIEVNVAYFSSNESSSASIFVPAVLQSIANAISGQQVSPLRVLASALTLILGFATVSIILYTAIRASITAIGRNPLANIAVRKGLVDVLVMATGVLAVTLATMYVIVSS